MPRRRRDGRKQRGVALVADMEIEELSAEVAFWLTQQKSFTRLFRERELRLEVGRRWRAAIANGRPEPAEWARLAKVFSGESMEMMLQIAIKRAEKAGKNDTE